MKIIFLLTAVLFSLTLRSQTSVYHPFPTTNANWVYQYFDDFGDPTMFYGGYNIQGDTIISGTTYKKIFGHSAYLYPGSSSGAIREDNKIVYFRPDTSSIDFVLYDFNLRLGDTLIHPYGGAVCSNDTITIVGEDSVLCSDGYHRMLYLSSMATWIEGIGSTTYLLRPADILCVSGNDRLECMMTDSGFSYPPGIGACILSAPSQSHPDVNVSISPNPASERVIIRSSILISRLKVLSLIGKDLYTLHHVGRNSEIHISFLPCGIYFLQIETGGGMVLKKFVKQ